ncbi:hypothetical protein [Brevibacterium litoralis]|uniref:hypothetical protein n=1 Tax=Brevibacterium litoralis TaxID=3138935 RepID=UPI0032EED285
MDTDLEFPFWETGDKLVDFAESRTGMDLSGLRDVLARVPGDTFHGVLAVLVEHRLVLPPSLFRELMEAKASVMDSTDADFFETNLEWFRSVEDQQARLAPA